MNYIHPAEKSVVAWASRRAKLIHTVTPRVMAVGKEESGLIRKRVQCSPKPHSFHLKTPLTTPEQSM